MKTKKKVALFTLLALSVILMLCFAWMYLTRGAQRIPTDHTSHISTIYILTKENGREEAQSLSGEDISDNLEADLLQCIKQYSMTKAPIPAPQSMEISDSYSYFSIGISNTGETSFRINVSSNKYHSSVQFGEKYFGIINSDRMLEDMEAILLQVK